MLWMTSLGGNLCDVMTCTIWAQIWAQFCVTWVTSLPDETILLSLRSVPWQSGQGDTISWQFSVRRWRRRCNDLHNWSADSSADSIWTILSDLICNLHSRVTRFGDNFPFRMAKAGWHNLWCGWKELDTIFSASAEPLDNLDKVIQFLDNFFFFFFCVVRLGSNFPWRDAEQGLTTGQFLDWTILSGKINTV